MPERRPGGLASLHIPDAMNIRPQSNSVSSPKAQATGPCSSGLSPVMRHWWWEYKSIMSERPSTTLKTVPFQQSMPKEREADYAVLLLAAVSRSLGLTGDPTDRSEGPVHGSVGHPLSAECLPLCQKLDLRQVCRVFFNFFSDIDLISARLH